MTSFYKSSVEEFLAQADEHILACLGTSYARQGYTSLFTDQTLTWERDISLLRSSLQQCAAESESAKSWGLLLEFSIPRKEMRIDVVLLIRDVIAVLEAKATLAASQAKRQVEEYALLLHYFHKASAECRIVPVIVSPEAGESNYNAINQRELFPQMPGYLVAPVSRVSWQGLSNLLLEVDRFTSRQIDVQFWDRSPYFPVPNIFEAALALKSGLSIR